MKNLRSLLAARQFGALRYSVVYESIQDTTQALVHALEAFGLEPEPLLLFEHEREAAHSILTGLLWKDMVHESECMPKAEAEYLAEAILSEHATVASKYFSNRKASMQAGWNSFTKSTFDSGVIVTGEHGVYFCIWFEDED